MLCNLPIALIAAPDRGSGLLLASKWSLIANNTVRGFKHGIMLFLVIYLLERYYKVRTSQYTSRNFLHDLGYWIYGKSDVARILLVGSWVAFLGRHFSFIQIHSFQSLPAFVRFPVAFIAVDFATYCIHRWQHSHPLLWAFHSVHHSGEQLTFATAARVHPVDNFVMTTLAFFPILLLGQAFDSMALPVYLSMEVLISIQHCEIPWRFGPLYRVVVSPTFHSFHHSTRPEHHNRNFGRLLSIWDYLFGTAVRDQTRPSAYGLQDWKMPTIKSQLCSPFAHAYADIRSKRAGQPGQEIPRTESI